MTTGIPFDTINDAGSPFTRIAIAFQSKTSQPVTFTSTITFYAQKRCMRVFIRWGGETFPK
jgi:hypothetical protein